MALLERSEWYDIARCTNWTPTYVDEAELFPDLMAGTMGVPMQQWEAYDEPYKTSYPEYVRIQREKDAGAYSVKAALERSRMFEQADPGWLSILKSHYGAIALGEYAAMSAEARMARLLIMLGCTVNDSDFVFPSREDMGALLGITTETASRIIAEFRRRGLVHMDKGCYIGCDQHELNRLANS